jgi:hypothetical protein
MRSTTSRPTPRQLAYLKALAQQTATSFAYPGSRSEASREIERLRQLPLLLTSDRDSVDGRVRDSDLERCAYATAPAPGEIVGYGSSASWRGQGSRR